jgi:selenocysteine lyase/cysteine desulfurase
LRISTHFYNDETDLARLVAELGTAKPYEAFAS